MEILLRTLWEHYYKNFHTASEFIQVDLYVSMYLLLLFIIMTPIIWIVNVIFFMKFFIFMNAHKFLLRNVSQLNYLALNTYFPMNVRYRSPFKFCRTQNVHIYVFYWRWHPYYMPCFSSLLLHIDVLGSFQFQAAFEELIECTRRI